MSLIARLQARFISPQALATHLWFQGSMSSWPGLILRAPFRCQGSGRQGRSHEGTRQVSWISSTTTPTKNEVPYFFIAARSAPACSASAGVLPVAVCSVARQSQLACLLPVWPWFHRGRCVVSIHRSGGTIEAACSGSNVRAIQARVVSSGRQLWATSIPSHECQANHCHGAPLLSTISVV